MLDDIRRELQRRLDELVGEVDKLRGALRALGSGGESTMRSTSGSGSARRTRRSSSATSSRAGRPARSPAKSGLRSASAPANTRAANTGGVGGTTTRRARGGTKAAVLEALAGGEAMTAGEVASLTGLGRASVSTTLSKLAKTGEVRKAARGYQMNGNAPGATADTQRIV